MKMRAFVFLVLTVATVYSSNDVDVEVPPPNINITTTDVPTTSTQKTTTSPTTTTTTPAPTPNTTTTSTTTTSTTPATTTVAPLPPKPRTPDFGTWAVSNKTTNRTCIVAKLALQIEVPYVSTQNKSVTGFLNLPSNATATGSCKNAFIKLSWLATNTTYNTVELQFEKVVNTTNYALASINVEFVPDAKDFPGYENNTEVHSLYHEREEFATPLSKSYKCSKEQKLNLTETEISNKTVAYIHLSNVQLQAYANNTGNEFGSAEDCAGSGTPDEVPIAVGCALVALIIIVLVAYLIGRRRSQARGYLSMFASGTKTESDYIPMKQLNCFK